LILGETGTGKELIARAIHKRSNRAERAFNRCELCRDTAVVDCIRAFRPRKRGLHGCDSKALGRFESANGGTIFLDEVGDLPADIQIALLRVSARA